MKKADIKTQTLDDGRVQISGTLPWEVFQAYEARAFAKLAEHLEVDGFRKGNVPEAIAKKHIGDALILADMAELAINELYPSIIEDEKIDAIGRPEFAITKLARDNELSFTLTTAVLPEIKLPSYKKIAKEVAAAGSVETTDEEITKVVEDLRQIRAYGHVHQPAPDQSGGLAGDHTHDDHGHTEPLPEVNDEFAKSFGNFATVEELRAKIKENILKEKAQSEKDKRRVAIMEELIKATEFVVPQVIIDGEKDRMLSQLEAEINRSDMSLDDYLTHTKKTKDALLAEFTPEAERRARFQMIINAIAKDAKLTASDEAVEAEAKKITELYPDSDMVRARAYADMVITNENVLSMLESQ